VVSVQSDPRDGSVFCAAEKLDLATHLAADADDLVLQLSKVASTSTFYQEKWGTEGRALLTAPPVERIGDILARLPLTFKDELRVAQEALPPYGTHLACDPSAVALVHRTSGTTGRPLVVASTEADIAVTSRHGAQSFWAAGIRRDDVVVHCLNYCMWAGGFTDHRCLEATGASVVPFGVGNTAELIELQTWLPFSALSCTPSYIGFLINQMSAAQLQLWRQNLRIVLVGGEPGGSEPALRELVKSAFDATVVNANYGMAEVLSNFGSECEFGGGMHFHGHGAVWVELLDPTDGTSMSLVPGSRGDLVVTHLRKEAQPLVRYATNDVMEIVSTDPCACGRSTFKFRLHGRADDMFVVRGINVFPSAVQAALGAYSPRLAEFVILLPDSSTFDSVPLVVEIDPGDTSIDVDALSEHLRKQLRCSVRLTMVAPGSLPRSSGKTKRLYRHGTRPEGLDLQDV
jgi:phenylacetate-CoA ligase